MRLIRPVLPLVLLAALVPPPAAAAPAIDLDLPDPADDVIFDPRQGSSFSASRPASDILRVVQRAEGEDIVLALTFAAPVGEPNADVDVLATAARGPGLSDQVIFGARWDHEGNAPATATTQSMLDGQLVDVNVTIEVEAETLTFRISGIPQTVPCFTAHTISYTVPTRDVEYSDWFYPAVSTCDENDVLAGAQGDCPASEAPGDDPLVLTLDDEAGDVRNVNIYGQEEDATGDVGLYDVTSFSSRREGDRIVQEVTLAEPRNASRPLYVEVIHRLGGGQDRDMEPEDALVVRYWRFTNGSVADRIEGEHVGAADGNDAVNFPIEFEADGATLRFSWCASIVPPDAPCVGIEVEASAGDFFTGTVRDAARPAVDPCLAAAPADGERLPPAGDDEPIDEEFVEEDPVDEEGSNESPGFGVLALLAALGLALVARRNRG